MSEQQRIQDWNYGNNGGSLYPIEEVSLNKWKRIKVDLDLSGLPHRWYAWQEVENRVKDWIYHFLHNWEHPSPINKQGEQISFNVAADAYYSYKELGGRMVCTNFSDIRLLTAYSGCLMKNKGKGPLA